MNSVLDEIFKSGKVSDGEGNIHAVHSHTSLEQCEFLEGLIQEIKPVSVLEVGLAYGISTVAMLDSLTRLNRPFKYVVIDPFQKQDWHDIGLTNIEKMKLSDKVSFYSKFSDQVLPELYNNNHRLQFAYIDSIKIFDVLMVDVYYIIKMLDVNGVVVLDDVSFPGIRVLARYLSQHPALKVYKVLSKDTSSGKINFLTDFYHAFLKRIPFRNRVLRNYNFSTDRELGLNYHCIAFQKVKEDDRNWDWYKAF